MNYDNLTDAELIQLFKLERAEQSERAKKNLFDFGTLMYEDFSNDWFHMKYYEILDKFAKGTISGEYAILI